MLQLSQVAISLLLKADGRYPNEYLLEIFIKGHDILQLSPLRQFVPSNLFLVDGVQSCGQGLAESAPRTNFLFFWSRSVDYSPIVGCAAEKAY